MGKYNKKKDGITYQCKNCKSIFFLPDELHEFYKETGCPHCGKLKWEIVPFSQLFNPEILV